MDLVCTWLTGPDAGSRSLLPPGRHVVGRAHTADVRCDDLALEPHHALLEVDGDGSVRLTQLTGRAPVRVAGTAVEATVTVPAGAWVEIGSSVLTVGAAPAPEPAATVLDGALVRSPRAVPEHTPVDLAEPLPPAADGERPGGLLPALLGLLAAAAMAALLHQPMFLLFGAMGSVAALGSWAAQRVAIARRRRRDEAAYRAACANHDAAVAAERERLRRHLVALTPGLDWALATAFARSSALWARRSDHADGHLVALGRGDVAWRTEVLTDVPVAVDLGPGRRVALRGPQALAVARALLVQLATCCGPADARLVVVTRRPGDWDCLRSLPHLALPDGTPAIIDEADLVATLAELERAAHVLLVTDQPALLAARTSPLRRAVADGGRGLLAVLGDGDGVPHVCASVLTTTAGPTARWVADSRATMLPVPVRHAGLGEQAAFRVAAALHPLADPEDPLSADLAVPRELSLATLLGSAACSPAGIVAAWAVAGTDPHPRTLLGAAADGLVDVDLVRDGPHGLVAGTTGAGKSELLRSLVAGMAAASSPAHLSFVLVDYKGGSTFDACARLPHVVGLVTDLDDQLADRALRSLHAELRRREALLREHLAADLTELRAAAPDVLLPRLVVVIDEFAALVAEQPAFLHSLVGVAQRGRSLGVHLLLATQRPHGVISDDIRANTNLRIALRLHDTADAVDVVGIAAPAQLPRGLPGRAVMRLGPDEHLVFQTARCTGPSPSGTGELHDLVRAIGEAARLVAAPTPPAPWLPPLPPHLDADHVPAGAVGLLDDPDRQAVVPLHWSPADGPVLVAGSPGAGVSSTLRTLAARALEHPAGEVYVLTAHADAEHDGLALHRRAELVHLHERVRLLRLLHRLRPTATATVEGERPTGPGATTVLVVDGLDLVRRALDHHETAEEHDLLDELLTSANGPVVVAGVEHLAQVPTSFLARCPHRWVLHLHDPHDASLVGVPAAAVPAAVPGRLRVAATGLLGQLVAPAAPRPSEGAEPHRRGRVSSIADLPRVVAPSTLPTASVGDGVTVLPVGLDVVGGGVAGLAVPDGEHVLVAGPTRSGRSTALSLLAAAWRDAHPTGMVVAVVPRRSGFDRALADAVAADLSALEVPADEPALVVVDDAELVDDPTGRLSALVGSGRPGVTVLAAGRPDALRQTYGHWTAVVRRSRLGLVLTGGSDLDGDLLGVALPRRLPLRARAGLGWVVADGTPRLAQVACWQPTAAREVAAR